MIAARDETGPAPLGTRDKDARELKSLSALLEAARSLGFTDAELEELRSHYEKPYGKEPS